MTRIRRVFANRAAIIGVGLLLLAVIAWAGVPQKDRNEIWSESGQIVACFYQDGRFVLNGTLTTNVASLSTDPLRKQWVARNDANEVEATIDLDGTTVGNMKIRGALWEFYPMATIPANPVTVYRDGEGTAVAAISSSGTLYLKGSLSQNAAISDVIPPNITVEPTAQTRSLGENVSFNLTASGPAPLAYQWKHEGFPLANDSRISGADSASLTITNLDKKDAGLYQCTVSNAGGSIDSAIVLLSITGGIISSGSNYLAFQAEDYNTISNPDAEIDVQTGYQTIHRENPEQVWTLINDAGAGNRMAMKAPASPHYSATDRLLQESILIYLLQFCGPEGNYRLYLRARTSAPSSPDSVWLSDPTGMSNDILAGSSAVGSSGNYTWTNTGLDYEVSGYLIGAALRFKIGVKNPDVVIDSIVLSQTANLTSAQLDSLFPISYFNLRAAAAGAGNSVIVG